MGLGPAPAVAALVDKSATATPLVVDSSGTPLPGNVAATPFPQGATSTPRALNLANEAATIEPFSVWEDSDETVQINAPRLPRASAAKLPTAPHLPRAPHPPRKVKEEEPELIEAEEIPASPSDALTLDALDAAYPSLLAGKQAADDFLVQLSAGTQGILGAPTIDVSNLDAPPPSLDRMDVDVDIVEEAEVELNEPHRAARTGTMPLFDMSAVLPAASDTVKSTASGAADIRARASDSPASVSVPAPASKTRERKFVVAPETPTSANANVNAPKAKRAGGLVWFGLVAVAAGVVAVVGLRGHRPEAHATTEPTQASAASEAPRVTAAEPLAQDRVATEAPSAMASAPSLVPPPSTTISVATTVTAPVTMSGSANLKPEPALEKPAVTAEPAPPPVEEEPVLETPAAPSKPPVEVHNAPPAAADGTEFDRSAARSALASAAAQASACRKDGDPSGTATITITFAPSGRITSANLQGPPFAGTATGGCIASTMRHANVPAFSGEHVTVTKTIVVQ